MKKLLLVLVLALCVCVGCVMDEVTGNVHVDPNVAATYESIATGAVSVTSALQSLFPWLAPIVTGLIGLLTMWRRLKPQLTDANRKNDDLVWGGEILATVLDEIKESQPEVWAKVGPGIHNAIKSSASVENAIREFRHLAPKE